MNLNLFGLGKFFEPPATAKPEIDPMLDKAAEKRLGYNINTRLYCTRCGGWGHGRELCKNPQRYPEF